MSNWREDAACVEYHTELFFGSLGQLGKRVCVECPVRQECLDYALSNGIEYGVYGGVSGAARRKMKGFVKQPTFAPDVYPVAA